MTIQYILTLLLLLLAPTRLNIAEKALKIYEKRSIVGKCVLIGIGIAIHVVAFRWAFRNEATSIAQTLSMNHEIAAQAGRISMVTIPMFLSMFVTIYSADSLYKSNQDEMAKVMRMILVSWSWGHAFALSHTFALDNNQYPMYIMKSDLLDFIGKIGVACSIGVYCTGIARLNEYHFAAKAIPGIIIMILVGYSTLATDSTSLIALYLTVLLLIGSGILQLCWQIGQLRHQIAPKKIESPPESM